MAALVVETERAWQALGAVQCGPTEAELPSRRFRRSLYIAEDMQPGDTLTPRNLRSIRPGHGLPPKYHDILLGKRVSKAVKAGTAMAWDLLFEDEK
ncbi:SAF domain-containing protein [Thiocapsa roseopersicina]|uniref:N-acetylneuraminate synthase n=1 Tax=Thiocapsa roseopersicina TaxID=1058 RepID=A0A1H2QCZ5_THIRO|nr:SAF domain-containing protein [Thiocapsa roseopersicina]SDW04790.1 N-acetylneuraminate synthase [Thiocapsa roseopersicina]